jgi:hypothetical protein
MAAGGPSTIFQATFKPQKYPVDQGLVSVDRVPSVAPLTQRIVLEWEPELRFYELGVQVLRLLQDRGELNAFSVEPEEVRGRLLEDRCVMVLSRARLDLTFWGADLDVMRGWDAATLAYGMVRPTTPTGFQIQLQHVVPLPSPFAAAVAAGYRRLFDLPGVEGVQFDDWAFLSDLVVPDGPARGGVEFGIVQPHEVELRLARHVGRAGRSLPGGSGFAPSVDLSTFADASLFADSWWSGPYESGTPYIQAALEFWGASRERSDRVVDAISGTLSADDQRGRRTA